MILYLVGFFDTTTKFYRIGQLRCVLLLLFISLFISICISILETTCNTSKRLKVGPQKDVQSGNTYSFLIRSLTLDPQIQSRLGLEEIYNSLLSSSFSKMNLNQSNFKAVLNTTCIGKQNQKKDQVRSNFYLGGGGGVEVSYLDLFSLFQGPPIVIVISYDNFNSQLQGQPCKARVLLPKYHHRDHLVHSYY